MTQPLTDAEREEARRLAEYVLAGGIADHRHELARAVLALDGEVERERGNIDAMDAMLGLSNQRVAELEAEVARLRENQYAVYDGAKREWDGIAADLRARAEAAEARVREPEESERDLQREMGAACYRGVTEHERAERLERAVREAPHESGCNVRARHAPDGKQTVWTSDGWTEITRYRCDCWKAKALEGPA